MTDEWNRPKGQAGWRPSLYLLGSAGVFILFEAVIAA